MLVIHVYSHTYSRYFPIMHYNTTKYYISINKGYWYKIPVTNKTWNSVELATLNQVTKEVTC